MTPMIEPRAEKRHIESVPGKCGGKPCIVGHRIRVQDVVLWTQQGQSPDEIIASFPQLSLADVYAALAYYFDHQALIDGDIREGDELAAQVQAAQSKSPPNDGPMRQAD